jgi:hypothetical protein
MDSPSDAYLANALGIDESGLQALRTLIRGMISVDKPPEKKPLRIQPPYGAMIGHTEKPGYVDVSIFVDGTKQISGWASIVENEVTAYIQGCREYETIEHLVKRGVITSFSITFNAPPSTPPS